MSANALFQRLEDHNLQCRRAYAAVAVWQEALAEVGAQHRLVRRAQVDGGADAGDRLPGGVERLVAAPRALEEEVQAVLLEDVQRVGTAHGADLLEADAG